MGRLEGSDRDNRDRGVKLPISRLQNGQNCGLREVYKRRGDLGEKKLVTAGVGPWGTDGHAACQSCSR